VIDPLILRVAGRYRTAQDDDFWDKAVEDLARFNSNYAKVQRKPEDTKTLRSTLVGIDKSIGFQVWAKKCLDSRVYDSVLAILRRVVAAVKSKVTTEPEMLGLINEFKDIAQKALSTAAPGSFEYSGFKVLNSQHIDEGKCLRTLEGIDYLKALFKKRLVEDILDQSLSKVILVLDAGSTAFLHSGTRELTLSVDQLSTGKSGRFIKWVNETLLHELGHYIHRNYLSDDARRSWDTPWDDQGLESLANPNYRAPGDRDEKLKDLDIVTEYGKVDKYEDFAETFLVFMVAPEKLTPTAKFRMQRALSLSGLYGKPVMRLAGEDPIVRAVVTRYSLSIPSIMSKADSPPLRDSSRL